MKTRNFSAVAKCCQMYLFERFLFESIIFDGTSIKQTTANNTQVRCQLILRHYKARKYSRSAVRKIARSVHQYTRTWHWKRYPVTLTKPLCLSFKWNWIKKLWLRWISFLLVLPRSSSLQTSDKMSTSTIRSSVCALFVTLFLAWNTPTGSKSLIASNCFPNYRSNLPSAINLLISVLSGSMPIESTTLLKTLKILDAWALK